MSEIQNIAMGERIRMIRERIGWTQEFLAEKIDISSVHLSRIENGKVTPGVDILIRVSEEMHVSIDELLFGKCSLNRELFYIEEKIQKMDESEKKFINRSEAVLLSVSLKESCAFEKTACKLFQ